VDWRFEAISRRHDRRSFDCGDQDLNVYLSRYARQNHEGGGARTFVAVDAGEERRVLGYYSISPASVRSDRVPPEFAQGRGGYPLPVYLVARLAVDLSVQGQGLGRRLLFDAGARAITVAREVGGSALLIDAKNQRAAAWYMRFGASPLLDEPLSLLLPLTVVAVALERSGGP
jgi:GNAT superfamily N-acetyltransferase